MTLSESAAAPADEVVLEAVGLTKHFPVRRRLRDLFSRTPAVVHAVDDVSFALRRGWVTALVGESGSGKSTVARLLAQIYPRTAGDLRLHGRSTRVRGGRPFRSYVRRVQLILQDPFASLNPVHTVRYHLTRSLRIHGNAGRSAEDLEAALGKLLTRVSLTPPERYLDAFPHELSGGQRQRVAIARALGADPEVLLADEPVSMLDVSIRLGVLNLLQDLKQRLNIAILYITHDIASARYFADETIVMYAGRMVEGGDSETVTQNPAHPYTRLLTDSAPDPERITGDGAGVDAAAGEDRGQGEPPSLITPPAGCRFHPRCPHAMRRCTADLPPRLTIGDRPGHWAACWLYDPATVAADTPGSAAPDADPAVPPPPAAVERDDNATLEETR
ncbi:peptide/nickel transport system ATP-binding protein [Micromonospora sp. A200]|uniref:ABC transporter ATP-binding protein n=1 Tax=Micromonospora sp. A200 TaxID=2940568 RepID=UPI00247B6C13|nr:peptide/nickel transport system ATP-binding protein [Micromonospora sp. A200]